MVLVDFFVTYDVYQDVSNKSNSTFDVSSNVVANLSSTLPNQENHKMFGGNYFMKSPLLAHNKSDGIWYTATIHAPPLKSCSLLAEVDVKKGRGSFDYPTEENKKIVVTVAWQQGRNTDVFLFRHWANWCSQTLRSFNQTTCLRILTKYCTFIQSICERYWQIRLNVSQPSDQEHGVFSFEFTHSQ